jgi:hypothetical protein
VGSLVPTVGYVLSNEFVEDAIGLMRRVGSRTLDEFPPIVGLGFSASGFGFAFSAARVVL